MNFDAFAYSERVVGGHRSVGRSVKSCEMYDFLLIGKLIVCGPVASALGCSAYRSETIIIGLVAMQP